MPYFKTSQSTWFLVGDISSNRLQAGITLGILDLVITVLAQEHRSSVYSLDTDFKKISGIQLYISVNS
ncbi:MAG: hypothetical protein NPIRA04_31270 [Nitrospirales bacterium]|nr:MAG: hypothetical protein NPIRA04_31270 [Nitrospirales bacterium]